MNFTGFRFIRIAKLDQILIAEIDNPPVNLITVDLLGELARLIDELDRSEDILVFILRSANPDFWIAHFDVNAILARPVDLPPQRIPGNNAAHELHLRFCRLNLVTIAQIEGRVGGGGAEFAMGFDMRFGVKGRTILNHMEVPLGIIPGGGGTQHLPRIVGRARALEMTLGAIDVDAETLDRWGWLNRALDPDQIDAAVMDLARRIASFPPNAVRAAKRAISAQQPSMREGLADECFESQNLLRQAESRAAMQSFLQLGGQTPQGERRIAALTGALG